MKSNLTPWRRSVDIELVPISERSGAMAGVFPPVESEDFLDILLDTCLYQYPPLTTSVLRLLFRHSRFDVMMMMMMIVDNDPAKVIA